MSSIKQNTIIAAFILGALRVLLATTVTPESFSWFQAYKDAAHLFMGGLFVAWRIQRQHWQLTAFVLLCILETSVAVISRM